MYKAELISADFEESTMEFDIQDKDFIAKKGEYVILEKSEFEDLADKANSSVIPSPIVKNPDQLISAYSEEKDASYRSRKKDFEIALKNLTSIYIRANITKNDIVHILHDFAKRILKS